MNEEQKREEFVASRKRFIGGSDIAHVVSVGDYACSRKLFFDKINKEPDFIDSNKPAFRRGRRLEPVAAAYYEQLTGRSLTPIGQVVSKTHPNCAVNADRLFYKQGETSPGYLEIKTVKSTFPIRKKGLYPAYLVQLHYGMAVAGWDYGAFAIYEPLNDELLHWDVVADKELGASLLEAGQKWWNDHVVAHVAPPPLAEESKPCTECVYRVTCRAFNADEITL